MLERMMASAKVGGQRRTVHALTQGAQPQASCRASWLGVGILPQGTHIIQHYIYHVLVKTHLQKLLYYRENPRGPI